MLKLVVCMKQVPMVSELPWDARTGTLKRELADGMMNPACRHALEAALQLKHRRGADITAVTMGPPAAREILHEAIAMGADRGIHLSDPRMAGADTFVTSFTLARAIGHVCPDFDLVLCGSHTTDSETAQVGPQLAEELDVPGAAGVEHLEIEGATLRMRREADDFLETLEMDLPGLVTVTTRQYPPRYVSFSGLEDAFGDVEILTLGCEALGLDPAAVGMKASPTRILKVYSPVAQKENVVLKGSPKKVVDELFDRFGDRIGGAMGKDLKPHDHPSENEWTDDE
jgi:electron transfer flavoprotein beta subunit